MRRILAVLLLLIGIGAVVPSASARAATVTLLSKSSSGWSSGWRTYTFGPPYYDFYVTWTYDGSNSCNSGSDHMLTKVYAPDWLQGGNVVIGSSAFYGPAAGEAYTDTYHINPSNYNVYANKTMTFAYYVGPQSACTGKIRVWEYA